RVEALVLGHEACAAHDEVALGERILVDDEQHAVDVVPLRLWGGGILDGEQAGEEQRDHGRPAGIFASGRSWSKSDSNQASARAGWRERSGTTRCASPARTGRSSARARSRPRSSAIRSPYSST